MKKIKKRLSFFWLVIYYTLFKRRKNVLYAGGVHFIQGGTGAGKTLLSSIIINNLCDKTLNFMWTNINQYDENNTKVFNFDDIFKDGKLAKRLDNTYCAGIVIDEANLMFNRRLNNRTSYNDLFLGLQQLVIAHRHLGLPRFYLIGQHLELQDIQLQRDIRYIHTVASSKKYSYYYYAKDNKMIKIPKKLYIKTFYKTETNEKIPVKKQKIKIKIKDLERYNTYGFLDYFKDLPIQF